MMPVHKILRGGKDRERRRYERLSHLKERDAKRKGKIDKIETGM